MLPQIQQNTDDPGPTESKYVTKLPPLTTQKYDFITGTDILSDKDMGAMGIGASEDLP